MFDSVKAKSFRPTKGKIFVTDMDEGVHKTAGGIILADDMGKDWGIRPRWGRVVMVADDVEDVRPGEWVLLEHGRWTKRIVLEVEGQDKLDVWMIDPDAILLVSDKDHSHQRIAL